MIKEAGCQDAMGQKLPENGQATGQSKNEDHKSIEDDHVGGQVENKDPKQKEADWFGGTIIMNWIPPLIRVMTITK